MSRLIARLQIGPQFMEFCFNLGLNCLMAIKNVIHEDGEVEYEERCDLEITSVSKRKYPEPDIVCGVFKRIPKNPKDGIISEDNVEVVIEISRNRKVFIFEARGYRLQAKLVKDPTGRYFSQVGGFSFSASVAGAESYAADEHEVLIVRRRMAERFGLSPEEILIVDAKPGLVFQNAKT